MNSALMHLDLFLSAASQPVYDVLIQNLSNLTLNPRTKFLSIKSENRPQPTIRRLGEGIPPQPTGRRLGEGIIPRRKGVRTLLSVRRERMEWMIRYFKNRYGKTQVSSCALGRQHCPTLRGRGPSYNLRCNSPWAKWVGIWFWGAGGKANRLGFSECPGN